MSLHIGIIISQFYSIYHTKYIFTHKSRFIFIEYINTSERVDSMDTHNSALMEKYRQQALEYAARAGLLNNGILNQTAVQSDKNNNGSDYETFLRLHPGK